jgi:hypothetical protein
MSNRIPIDLRLKWFLDDLWAHWRRIHRLYVTRAYSWGTR